MIIELTPQDCRALVLALEAGSTVYGTLSDDDGAAAEHAVTYERIEKVIQSVLTSAERHGLAGIAERFHGELIPDNDLSLDAERAMDEYNNETFWFELEVRLGQRDFQQTKTAADQREIEAHHGMLPERIQQLYDRYTKEFERHGIERLAINEAGQSSHVKQQPVAKIPRQQPHPQYDNQRPKDRII